MPQIRMKVGGMEYAINSDEDEAYVKSIGARLDARLDALAKKNPFLSTTMVAILAALEAYDETKKAEQEIEKLRLEIKQLLEENAMSKMTAAMANRRLQEVLTERAERDEEEYVAPPNAVEAEEAVEEEDDEEAVLWEDQDEIDELKISEDETGQYEIF